MPAALIHELDGDDVRCEWCGVQVIFHPQDENGTFRCFDIRHDLPKLEGFRWVTP